MPNISVIFLQVMELITEFQRFNRVSIMSNQCCVALYRKTFITFIRRGLSCFWLFGRQFQLLCIMLRHLLWLLVECQIKFKLAKLALL